MTQLRVGLLLLCGGACSITAGRPARAAGEEEWQVGGRLGGALAPGAAGRAAGGLVGLEAVYGLSDAWAVRAGFDLSVHAGETSPVHRTGALWGLGVSGGLVYTLDVLRWLPILELGGAVLDLRGTGAPADPTTLALEIGAGVDYLLTPRWALGLFVRDQIAFLRLRPGPVKTGAENSIISAALRLSRLF